MSRSETLYQTCLTPKPHPACNHMLLRVCGFSRKSTRVQWFLAASERQKRQPKSLVKGLRRNTTLSLCIDIDDEGFGGLPDNPGTGLFSPLQRKSRAEKEGDGEWRDNIFYSHKQGQVIVALLIKICVNVMHHVFADNSRVYIHWICCL